MGSLGTFGKHHDKIDSTFDFFDLTVRVNPTCSKASVTEFLAEAGQVEQNDEVRGAQIIMAFMREIVHPDDWDAFWSKAKAERQDPETDLMPIGRAVMEAISGFPTGPLSDSPGGPGSTGQRSVVDLPASDILPTPNLAPAGSVAAQALAKLRSRVDLQEQVVQAQEQMAVAR